MGNKVFLENLPTKYGIGYNKDKIVIDWKKSVGENIKCLYNDEYYYIEIVGYESKRQRLTIKYNDRYKNIHTSHFIDCKLGELFGVITSEFKINIPSVINEAKRQLIITDREYRNRKSFKGDSVYIRNDKWYKYTCKKCGWTEGWIEECELLKRKTGCSCCNGKTLVQGINDISTLRPDLIKFFKNQDEANFLTIGSHNRVKVRCPECGDVKSMDVSSLTLHGYSCLKCSDGIKLPEKFTINILNQTGLEYKTQLTKNTLIWVGKYRYDFYFKLNKEEYIIETHGMQHYKQNTRKGSKTLKEEQANDKLKKELALANGIKEENYIVIDCRYSELEWIKNSILNSRLNEIICIDKVDFERAFQNSMKNLSVIVRDRYNNRSEKESITAADINRELGINNANYYLNFWTNIGMCDYNPKSFCKKIAMYDMHENFIDEFESASKIQKISEDMFGVKLNASKILLVASNKRRHHKGYVFKYV